MRSGIAAGLLALAAWAEESRLPWPGFLPPRGTFPTDLVAAVERTWTEWTLSRTIQGRPARAPLDLYAALIDAPDVTAAAARHRMLARHAVRHVRDDLYEAEDRQGSRGFYQILVRERDRRVIFSWGEHSGSLLGTIRGDAITVLTLEPRGQEIAQELTAYVRIENRVAATLARALIVIFGGVADRRLSEGFAVAAQVAEWAVAEPDEFCGWLNRSALPRERWAPIARLPACR